MGDRIMSARRRFAARKPASELQIIKPEQAKKATVLLSPAGALYLAPNGLEQLATLIAMEQQIRTYQRGTPLNALTNQGWIPIKNGKPEFRVGQRPTPNAQRTLERIVP